MIYESSSVRAARRCGVALLVALVAMSCARSKDSANPPRQPPLVVATAVQSTAAPAIVRRGVVTPRASFRLGFGVPGTVASICCRVGDRVRRGQVVATLSRAESDARVMAASAGQSRALREYTTTSRLVETGALAPSQVQSAGEMLEMANAERLLAKEFASRTRLLSPLDGVIAGRHAEPGEVVGAGTPIMVVADSGTLRIQVGLTQRELLWAGDGAVVEIGDEGDSKIGSDDGAKDSAIDGNSYAAARIGFVAPTPNVEDGLFTVEVVPEKGSSVKLETGAMTRVRFNNPKLEPGMLVPLDAVIKRQGAYGVMVLAGDDSQKRASFRRVDAGKTHGNSRWIRAGLRDGEVIISEGAYFIDDGQEVRVNAVAVQHER